MTRSKASLSKPIRTLKFCLLPRKAISLNYDKKDSHLRSDVLSHLSTMTFIARQLGYKVSLTVSGREY